jgi:8-oxo-dGTP pyrophosphatase MutT (NUDIX family)
MQNYVKILITEGSKTLEHLYLASNEWGTPSGFAEDNETPLQAAVRELLERTGYEINPDKLEYAGKEETFHIFKGQKKDLTKVAEPGEKGGYSTSVRWA